MKGNIASTQGKLRWLKRHRYQLKNSEIGWWVDGACGFLVSGYFKYRHEAIKTAFERVREAKAKDEHPTWLF